MGNVVYLIVHKGTYLGYNTRLTDNKLRASLPVVARIPSNNKYQLCDNNSTLR